MNRLCVQDHLMKDIHFILALNLRWISKRGGGGAWRLHTYHSSSLYSQCHIDWVSLDTSRRYFSRKLKPQKATECLLIESCVDNTSLKLPRGIKINHVKVNCLNLIKIRENHWCWIQDQGRICSYIVTQSRHYLEIISAFLDCEVRLFYKILTENRPHLESEWIISH